MKFSHSKSLNTLVDLFRPLVVLITSSTSTPGSKTIATYPEIPIQMPIDCWLDQVVKHYTSSAEAHRLPRQTVVTEIRHFKDNADSHEYLVAEAKRQNKKYLIRIERTVSQTVGIEFASNPSQDPLLLPVCSACDTATLIQSWPIITTAGASFGCSLIETIRFESDHLTLLDLIIASERTYHHTNAKEHQCFGYSAVIANVIRNVYNDTLTQTDNSSQPSTSKRTTLQAQPQPPRDVQPSNVGGKFRSFSIQKQDPEVETIQKAVESKREDINKQIAEAAENWKKIEMFPTIEASIAAAEEELRSEREKTAETRRQIEILERQIEELRAKSGAASFDTSVALAQSTSQL